jgi:ubiquinol-cytochrome c reductase cytochrome c subunit
MKTFVLSAFLILAMHDARAQTHVERGQQLYMKVGCYQCHGTVGQGSVAGTRLAPTPMAWEAFAQFVHNTTDAMPPYRESVLPTADLKDIHAFLSAVPAPKPVSEIPLLRQLSKSKSN